MSLKGMEFYRLEDRVLFEAAAAVEIVEAAENNDNPNANMNEADRQAQEERDAIKNAPPENPADAAMAQADASDPSDMADPDAEFQKLIEGDIPVFDAGDLDPAIDALITDIFHPVVPEGDLMHLTLNNNGETVSTGKELVIINSSVMDADTIISELAPNQEVLRLEAGSDAMQQILDYLDSSDTQYDSIHIVSHGNAGYFVLNGEVFDGENFDAAEWAAVGEHVTENGDILLYGCNLAENAAGRDFIAQIADASGADVAASTNATGIGGDWSLEYSHGLIETTSISVENYNFRLTAWTVDSGADSGAGSLRNAVDNLAAAGDEINITVNAITLTGSQIDINFDLTISGRVISDSSITTITASSGNRIFNITGNANVTLDTLALVGNGSGTGNGGVINVDAGSSLMLENSTVTNGTASGNGGAIYNAGTLDIVNSTIYGNKSTYNPTGFPVPGGGGAIYTAGILNVVNSTIAGNATTSTNSVVGGGGIAGTGTVNVLNSIVAGNYIKGDQNDDNDIVVLGTCNIQSSLIGYASINNSDYSGNTTIQAIFGGAVTWSASTNPTTGLYDLVDGSGNKLFNGVVCIPLAFTTGAMTGTDAAGNHVYRSGTNWLRVDNSAASGDVSINWGDQLGYGRKVTASSIGAYQSSANRVVGWYGNADVFQASGFFTTLSDGIASANTSAASPLYLYGITITPGATVSISKTITIIGAGAANTVISGGWSGGTATNGVRVFSISGATTVVTLDGLTVTKGRISGNDGGGIYVASGTINVSNSTISGNKASHGGGIFGYGTINVSNSTISGNTVSNDGGGIYGWGTINVTNSTISGNKASTNGGGILGVSTINVTNSTVSGNTAGMSGGGIYGTSTINVTNSTVSGNLASSYGGGIYGSSSSTINVLNSIVLGNYVGAMPTTANDIDSFGTLNMSYSVYGVRTGSGTIGGNVGNTTGATIKTLFNAKWSNGVGGKYQLVMDDGTNTLALADHGGTTQTIAILSNSAAAYKGTKVYQGDTDKNYYYSTDGGTNFLNAAGTLDSSTQGHTAITDAQNSSNATIRELGGTVYNVGAYALSTVYAKSTVVTSNLDDRETLNPFVDGVTLREAVEYANSHSGGNITFSTTVFTADTTITLDAIYGAIAINSDVTITGPTAARVTVTVPVTGRSFNEATQQWEDNANASTFRVFNIAAGLTVSLSNLALLGGDISGNVGTESYGGVISLASGDTNPSTLNLDKVTVQGGKARFGGGIFGGISSTITLTNSTVSGNSATSDGGGIYGYTNSTITLTNSTVSTNSANYGGGGIYGGTNSTITLTNSTVSGNSAMNGGGISGIGAITVLNSIVLGNTANSNNDISADGTFNAAYSIFTASKAATGPGNIIDALAADIFDGHANGLYIIKADGAAAYKGTLVGKIGDVLWYKDGTVWRNFADTTTKTFSTNAANNYGLGSTASGASVYKTAQNDGSDIRLQGLAPNGIPGLSVFSTGAYALSYGTPEALSLTVTTLDDIVNPFDNQTSLREAIIYANTLTGDQAIDFVSGLTGTITLDAFYGANGLAINKNGLNLTIAGDNRITVDGGAQWSIDPDTYVTTVTKTGVRIFTTSTSGTSVTLNDMTLQNGYTTGNGGAISFAGTGKLTLNNVTVTHNYADTAGGGIHGAVTMVGGSVSGNYAGTSGGGINGNVNLTDVIVSGNVATGGGGISLTSGTLKGTLNSSTGTSTMEVRGNISLMASEGVAAAGIYAGGGTLSLDGVAISGNKSVGALGYGGGIYNTKTVITVKNTIFEGNQAAYGGAYFQNQGSDVLQLIENVTFRSNIGGFGLAVSTAGGGALHLTNAATMTILSTTTNIVFESNMSYGNGNYGGGAVYVSDGAFNIQKDADVTFKNNFAVNGGAIYVGRSATASIAAGTFTGNTASTNGGAIYVGGARANSWVGGTLTLENSALYNNTASGGGGAIYAVNSAQVSIVNSTLYNNTAVRGGAIHIQLNASASAGITRTSTLNIVNSTIYNNLGAWGGAIYEATTNAGESITVNILNSILVVRS